MIFKNYTFFCVLILLTLVLPANAQSSKTSIRISDNNGVEAITDLKNALSGYQAGNITITKVPLENRTGQEFYLSVSGNNTDIRYTTKSSLENAVYTYLDMLGFKWYGPGDNWFIKPARLLITTVPGKWFQPTFRNRTFFGTGGLDFGAVQLYDPQNTYKQKWYAWKRRNRYNADFEAIGHTGSAFYNANKNVLDANPSWFSSESGKVNGRLKIDQPRVVQVYKEWVKTQYNASGRAFKILGVDPEDGRGGADDPLPKNMKNIKNHADKWWWLANEVAKDYPENDRHTMITAYAYGDGPYNALAPSFSLRKNVYPVIIPYAFQTAYQPEQMVKVWASKITGNMGIYDYWNITQWSLGMPQFSIYAIQPKLKFWSQNKIDGVYLETTDAAGPMGHAFWLAGQLQWDVNKNFNDLYQQYLNDCFGKAAPVMKRMFDRWSNNYQAAGDVVLSLRDLKDASTMVTKSSPEWKRITELKAYVHFMKLFYAHNGTQESKNNLYRYMYSIHHLMMVQTAAFVGQAYITPLNAGNVVPDGRNIKPLTLNDIEEQFQRDVKENPAGYDISTTAFDLRKVKYTEPINNNSWLFGGFQCNFFFLAPFSGTVEIDAGAETNGSINIFSDTKSFVKENIGQQAYDYKETISGHTWYMKKYKITIQKGGIYHIRASYGNNRVKINTPGIVLFKTPGAEDFDNYAYPIQFFYVPEDTKEIIFYDAQPEGTNGRGFLITPSGKALNRQTTGMKDLYKVQVAPADRGKIWTANFGHPSWSFKNIPNYTSLQKFQYVE